MPRKSKKAFTNKSLHGKIKIVFSGKSQEGIAGIVGISRQTVQGWCKEGGSLPTVDQLQKIHAATGVDLNWLLDDAAPLPVDGDYPRANGHSPPENITDFESGKQQVATAQKLQKEIDRQKKTIDRLHQMLDSAMEDVARAEEAARTAGQLHENGGNGA